MKYHNRCDWYKYQNIKRTLAKDIYSNINLGTTSNEALLTDHGLEHVDRVIEKADEICVHSNITPYETQLLLLAILFHDIGNISGRRNHSNGQKISDVIGEMIEDSLEKRAILDIAGAHSGPDSLGELNKKITIWGESIRLQLLASILRFADELADDRTRSFWKYREKLNIPKGSYIHHLYAHCLHSVELVLDEKEINLHFEVLKHMLGEKWGKNSQGQNGVEYVYLIDEIVKRTIKTYKEMQYCGFFMPSEMQYKKISVKIVICDDASYHPILGDINFTLAPRIPSCPKEITYLVSWSESSKEYEELNGEIIQKIFCNQGNET